MKHWQWTVCLGLLLAGGWHADVQAQVGNPPYAFSAGATATAGNGARLQATIGQSWVGHMESGTMQVRLGFWASAASTDTGTGVTPAGETPGRFHLEQNYPNPFNPSTHIGYALGATGPVRLTVHDVLGREVAVLVEQVQPAGTYGVTFEATHLPSGIYLYRLDADGRQVVRRMLLLK